MLGPYLAMLCAIPLAAMTFRNRATTWLFVALFASCLYGFLFAVGNDRLVAGGFDVLRWMLPPMVALAIFQNPEHQKSLRWKLVLFAFLFAVATSLYGLYQYIFVPRWDAEWMIYSNMESIGKPRPYEVRVFSTLNSPGSYSLILTVNLLLLAGRGGIICLLAIAVGALGLGLTIVRSAWIAAALGLIFIALAGRWQARASLATLLVVSIFAIPPILLATGTETYIGDRFRTLFDLQSDVSFNDRSNGYDRLLNQLNDNVFGTGLAVNGAIAAHSSEGTTVVIDGGPIEIFYALGLAFGLVYLLALGVLSMRAFFNGDRGLAGPRAAILCTLALLTSGTTTVGEVGFFFWICLGMSLPPAIATRRKTLSMRDPSSVSYEMQANPGSAGTHSVPAGAS
ncbi:hypothetical protein [Xaviernesmea oryzae]|nr:hypothetical protein [Xaviernesmea oryzae]